MVALAKPAVIPSWNWVGQRFPGVQASERKWLAQVFTTAQCGKLSRGFRPRPDTWSGSSDAPKVEPVPVTSLYFPAARNRLHFSGPVDGAHLAARKDHLAYMQDKCAMRLSAWWLARTPILVEFNRLDSQVAEDTGLRL
jgi:hypothetical protein